MHILKCNKDGDVVHENTNRRHTFLRAYLVNI